MSCSGDADDARSWGRGTLALCGGVCGAARRRDERGRVLKRTGRQRWWLEDGVGRSEGSG